MVKKYVENTPNMVLSVNDVISAHTFIFLCFKCNVQSLKRIKTIICYNKFCPCILGKSISFFRGHPIHELC